MRLLASNGFLNKAMGVSFGQERVSQWVCKAQANSRRAKEAHGNKDFRTESP
jgi:hypothetical protein